MFTHSVTFAISSGDGDGEGEADDRGGVIGPVLSGPSARYMLLISKGVDSCSLVELMVLISDGDAVQST